MNILFVCTGNTCRSPMAEGYLRSKKIKGLTVASCGIMADRSPATDLAVKAMLEKGIDISGHISSQITAEAVNCADKILCLSNSHLECLKSAGVDARKLYLLGDGISDPFGGNLDTYKKCRGEIFLAIDRLINSGFFCSYKISPINIYHIPQIAKLEKICFSEPWSENGLLESYKNGTRFFIAEDNGNVLGYVGLSAVMDEGYITNIAVFPQYRKKDIATDLLNAVFEFAKQKNLTFVSLEVRKSNINAVSLYEKSGFKVEGLRKCFYNNPKEDALIMTKRFDMNNENFKH